MANGKRELIEDISDIRRLAGLSEAPKKPASNPQDIEGKGDLGGIFGNPKGSDYQSKGGQVVSPQGKVNWGDPDSASDFFRADKMQQAQQAQAEPAPKAAAPKAPAQSVDDIKAFQRANGLSPDGIVGPKTREAQARANSTPKDQRNTIGGVAPELSTARYDMPDKPTDTEKALQYPQGGPPQAQTKPQGSVYAPPAVPGTDTVPQSMYRIPGSDIANPGVQKPTQSITNQPPAATTPRQPEMISDPDKSRNTSPKEAPPPLPSPKPFVEPKTFTPPDKKPAASNAPYSPGGGAVDDKRTFLQRNLPNALGGLDAPPQINPSAPKLEIPKNIAPAPMPVIRTPTPNVDNMPVQQFKGPNVDPGMDATNKLPKIEPFKGDMGDSFTGSAGPTPKATAPKPQANLNRSRDDINFDTADKDPDTMKDIVKELRQMAGIPEDGIPGQGMAQEAMNRYESEEKMDEEDEMEEGNEFSGALAKAKATHQDKFEVGGKTYDVKEAQERTMSRAAKGYEKYGKEGMKALAKAGKEGKDLDKVRDKYNKYDDKVEEGIEVNPINDSLALIKRLAGLK